MSHLTTSQIAELIRQGFAADGITNVQIKDYAATTKRRKYPVVEVVNVQPTGKEADIRITKITQKFEVNAYVRKRGAGSDEINLLSKIEHSILTKLDNSNLSGDTLFTENKSWARSGEVIEKPVTHYRSILSVLITDIISTSGDGTIGAGIFFSIGTLTNMQVLSKPVEREIELTSDEYDDTRTRKRVAPLGDTHSVFVEVEYTQARIDALRTMKASHSKQACVTTRDGVPENFNGYPAEFPHGAVYMETETIIIRVERV